MTSCDSCSYTYFSAISNFFENVDSSVRFLGDLKVLPNEGVCPKCGAQCIYREDQNVWRCTSTYVIRNTRKRRSCDFSVSDRKGTFLDRIRFPPWKMVLFVNHFLSRYWDHKGVMESLHLSSATCWNRGGVGIEVEIDETLISRRKYGRGQMRKQIWLFGGIELVNKRRFVFSLTGSVGHKRNKETLIPLIKST